MRICVISRGGTSHRVFAKLCQVFAIEASSVTVMPGFQTPSVTGKRKSEVNEFDSRKKQAVETGNGRYWMVQWCVLVDL